MPVLTKTVGLNLCEQSLKINSSLFKMKVFTSFINRYITPVFSKLKDTLDFNHFIELFLFSGIHPDLLASNFSSISDEDFFEKICSSLELERRNGGRLSNKVLWKFRDVAKGGWYCAGLDALKGFHTNLWGCYKPNTPRLDYKKGKPIKYEHPQKTDASVFFLDVPITVWHIIAEHYDITLTESDLQLGFWQWVFQHPEIPIIVTEGAKKAACLLSAGYVAIGLPGISMGYRTIKDPVTEVVLDRYLAPELDYFATLGRHFIFCFDYEVKQSTQQNCRINISLTSKLLVRKASQVSVITLPGPEKGCDDFIVEQGVSAFDSCYQEAENYEIWLNQSSHLLTYQPTSLIKKRYLGDIQFPENGFAFIKAPKGTGKTTSLKKLVEEARGVGRKTLVLSYRIQLCRAICSKENLGIEYIEDVRKSDTGDLLGYGLCIDSLHPDSQASFNPLNWKGSIVIIDEIEQVLWHVLNSKTCYRNRVKILQTLKTLIQEVMRSGGLIIGLDADLSDYSIDYLLGLSEQKTKPWLLVNDFKPETGWDIDFYETPNPTPALAKMLSLLREDKKIYISLDSQKSRSQWSSKNLEQYLSDHFPNKRIIRIDSESVGDPHSPAYGVIDVLNQELINYDIVIATPSLGSGVSIDIRGHFNAVFGIFQGAIPTSEVRQALARVREDVPRYLWARTFSANKVGNGSNNYRNLLTSVQKYVKQTIRLLRDFDFDVDRASDPVHLRTWAKMASRVNASMHQYRQNLKLGLIDEGHTIRVINVDPSPEHSKILRQEISELRDQNRELEASAVAQADDISESEALKLGDKRSKTTKERLEIMKYNLAQKYGIPVTSELKQRDEDGWYRKLQLHYFFLSDPTAVKERDKEHLINHIDRGEGSLCLQDIRLLTSRVEILKLFNIQQFLKPDRDLRKTDQDVIEFHRAALQVKDDLKTFLGIKVPDTNPIQAIGIFLDRLGLKLDCIKREQTKDGKRIRVYRFIEPTDGREQVFEYWRSKQSEIRPHLDITEHINKHNDSTAA